MQYLISLLVPPMLLLVAGRRRGLLRIGVASVALTYLVAVGTAFALSAWYSHDAEAYDLNRDGIISSTEQSPAQRTAQGLAINDAGRNLSVLFAAPWAILVSVVFFGLAAAVRLVARKYRQQPAVSANIRQVSESIRGPSDA